MYQPTCPCCLCASSHLHHLLASALKTLACAGTAVSVLFPLTLKQLRGPGCVVAHEKDRGAEKWSPLPAVLKGVGLVHWLQSYLLCLWILRFQDPQHRKEP